MPKSVRWRLPLSYAAIALLATLALGLVLLTTLRDHYRQQERDYLTSNAETIGAAMTRLLELEMPSTLLQSQLGSFAFLSRTRVRLLDADLQPMADSGPPQEQREMVTLATRGKMLDIQPSDEIPATPPDVGGLFVRRDGDTLIIGTGNLSGYRVDDDDQGAYHWELQHDGPVVGVLANRDTLVYRDDTTQGLIEIPAGLLQQILHPSTLDEIGLSSTLSAWGQTSVDGLLADVIVYAEKPPSGQLPSRDELEQASAPSPPGVLHPSGARAGLERSPPHVHPG